LIFFNGAFGHYLKKRELDIKSKILSPADEEYIDNNYRKVLSHEYRAFFDIADWLTIIYRTKIKQLLEGRELSSVLEAYPDYPKCKEFLIGSNEIIAKLREDKDYNNELQNEMIRYHELLVQMNMYYKEISYRFDAPLSPPVEIYLMRHCRHQ